MPLRAKILEIAAGLDRLDRAGGSLGDDERRERLRQAIGLLLADEPTGPSGCSCCLVGSMTRSGGSEFEL